VNKIEFGIGINTGQLIIEEKEGKFKFISLGNTITTAKKISQQSISNILLSDAFHEKTRGKIRSLKLPGQNLWKTRSNLELLKQRRPLRK
ncbi:MAG: hypothetical protein ABIH92_05940, partial [Nanoarchaeota archaeon]